MDKNEYKTKYEEMKELIAAGKTDEVLDMIDSMNWRKVHNVNALVKASQVCEEAGRLTEARELLYMAHDRSPIGRMIIYHLAMICVKLGDLEEAQEYYDEFVEIAPHDSLKYIIKYQISKAKGADYDTLIAVLEELKEHDFIEEWAYELAYLYHKTMQIDKCISLCDDIILWFGEGPYVERALEMKMIYQPLDAAQEDKYRRFQQKRDGITEIRANEQLASGEIIPETIAIPSVELPSERFNTVNLQAEIKKNIDEIMRATEAEAVSENMENIKSLVEEIPYLQVVEKQDAQTVQQTNAEIDAALVDNFQEYLAEEYDGQLSLLVPEQKEIEKQVEGQLSIEDIMEEWEKTKRAAEAALQEAQQQKLESAKSQALLEASQIMDRLEEAIPRLDAGTTPTDLLKEEYLAKEMPEELPEKASGETPATFHIPSGKEGGSGIEIPIITAEQLQNGKVELPEGMPDSSEEQARTDVRDWWPPILDRETEPAEAREPEISEEEADAEVQQPEISEEEADAEVQQPEISEEEADAEVQQPEISEEEADAQVQLAEKENGAQQPEEEADRKDKAVDYREASKIVEDVNQMLQREIDRILEENAKAGMDHGTDPLEKLAAEVGKKTGELAEADSEGQEEIPEQVTAVREAEEVLPEIAPVELEPEDMVQLLDEKVLEKAIQDEIPRQRLSEEEKEIFSYFMPISGMEKTICQSLTGARYYLNHKNNSAVGNILILGGSGSGKTMLASNLIKVLQMQTGKLTGSVGKIDASQLNQKDVAKVFSMVNGGSLIIEGAGDLTEKTAETLRQQMIREDQSVMVIMEGQKTEIEKVLSLNTALGAMFTEKITIPIFTIDELVNFGKVYALEEGYAVDEMGILAMYNRINLIQRNDHPTSLNEVRDIMEEAIKHAEKGGLKAAFSRFGSKRYDEDGNLILHEQDFEK